MTTRYGAGARVILASAAILLPSIVSCASPTPIIVPVTVVIVPTVAPPQASPTVAASPSPAPTSTASAVLAPPPNTPLAFRRIPIDGDKGWVRFVLYPAWYLSAPGVQFQVGNELLIQVEAHRENQRDGFDVEKVAFDFSDSQGRQVYGHTEQNAPYCAFRDTNVVCNTWNFAANNRRWPASDGAPSNSAKQVVTGIYRLNVTIFAKQNKQWDSSIPFRIQQ